ncbi:MAG: choice-of-anchor Q domain-containing protein [Aggregatilineales bacterium]
MPKSRIMAILAVLILSALTFTAQIQPAHAANCGGLPVTGGVIPAGTYTMSDNCVITATLRVNATVTINGNGYALDGGNTFQVLTVFGTLSLNNVTVRNGYLAGLGAGLYNAGTITINNSIFSNNNTTGGGGAINHVGTLITINNSMFINNTGQFFGGAINTNYPLTITNSTFIDNTAGDKGGVIQNYGGTVTLINNTFSSNSAPNGAVVNNDNVAGGVVTMTNNIMSGNTGTTCSVIMPVDNGGNLEDVNNCGLTTGSNTNPLLGAFNGSYYPLLAGSPAIDGAPTCAGLTNDQIGTARPQGVACDIGAIEMPQAAVVNPTTGETTFEIIQIAVPSLNEWSATATENRAEAYGVQDNVYATVHMQNGAWQYNSGGVPQDLIDYGVILAIDVWEQGGDQFFDHYEKVCLQGEGRLIYFDATLSPRPMVEITPVTFEDGYTCGWIPNAGTLVLIDPE